MFKLIHLLPEKVILACSGGVDSMAALHWLGQGRKLAGVVYVNHNTGNYADEAEKLTGNHCFFEHIEWECYQINGSPPAGLSKEAWWRGQRYEFFNKAHIKFGNLPIVTAHNLNDCVEEYVINLAVRGRIGTIPYSRGPVIRPFRTWSKDSIYKYAKKHKLTWLEDPSNTDTKYLRNKVRHETLPKLLELNPGLINMVKRMLESEKL